MARKLSNWLRSYAEFTSDSEAPDILNFWVGVSTIAGALRRHVFIDQLKFKWSPNFYVILVAPPGVVTKSSTIGVGMSLLHQVEGIFMGPASMTWQGLTTALQGATTLVPLNDTGDLLTTQYASMSAITCEVGELGTFLDPRNDELVSVLIDLWDGKEGHWERWLRTSDNTKIANPWINIIAATTPAWLRANFPEVMIGGGLASRIIFVYAEAKKALVPYISRCIKPSDYYELEKLLVHDLNQIAEIKGPYELTDEAYDFGSEWYEGHWRNPSQHLTGDRFLGYKARKQTHIHKLAMVLAAAESNEKIITKDHLELALKFVTGVEYDMHKVFESVSSNESAKQIFYLINHLKNYGKLAKQDLWRMCMRMMAPKEFTAAIDAAVSAGYITARAENGQIMIIYLGGEDYESEAIKRALDK